jgi:hypothetical protein
MTPGRARSRPALAAAAVQIMERHASTSCWWWTTQASWSARSTCTICFRAKVV